MKIGGFQKVSLIDYPGKISAVVFTQGCNFRCPFCHNPELVDPERFANRIPEPEILAFLEKRKGRLDAAVITGGEPTLQSELIPFTIHLKAMGYLIKLDTNGALPDVLEDLLGRGLIDYLAMDIKAPLERYGEITKTKTDVERIRRSISLIMGSGVDYEFRTTAVRSLLGLQELEAIGRLIPGAKRFVLQKFVPTKTLDRDYLGESSYSDAELKTVVEKLAGVVRKATQR
ncbi:MAG: anaerobic ribonucleoside-triphosphate reductase activating protein [Syntrophales bacterium]|jgi:pyruvate formate lyase activating enzyme|nr:anaerobic ribonucleoside-triphosphate reductase activating protein [Syntrophales bacterium]MCU0554334.1 anaerobic ribonucleoside-triphosphate reductase activating protein [Syntrophales bacterium]